MDKPKEPDRFTLDPTPKPEPWKPVPPEKLRQKKLFSGMNACPDQLDLFPTDGEETPPA